MTDVHGDGSFAAGLKIRRDGFYNAFNYLISGTLRTSRAQIVLRLSLLT